MHYTRHNTKCSAINCPWYHLQIFLFMRFLFWFWNLREDNVFCCTLPSSGSGRHQRKESDFQLVQILPVHCTSVKLTGIHSKLIHTGLTHLTLTLHNPFPIVFSKKKKMSRVFWSIWQMLCLKWLYDLWVHIQPLKGHHVYLLKSVTLLCDA